MLTRPKIDSIAATLLLVVTVSARADIMPELATEADIKMLDGCLQMLALEHKRYPSQNESLSVLVTGLRDTRETNFGPYIKSVPKDWWDRPYMYRFPAVHNPEGPDVYSLGKDGISKTGGNDPDDINNWNRNTPWREYYSRGRLPSWYQHIDEITVCTVASAFALVFLFIRRRDQSSTHLPS